VEAETGAVVLRCDYDETNSCALIRVTDNGDGIEKERLKRLFMPFQSTKGLKGTGLGLVVTKKIVEEHRGSIKVESLPKKGTTFTIMLPASVDGASPTSLADTLGTIEVPKEDDE
jgi:signal transduction histidine kinase